MISRPEAKHTTGQKSETAAPPKVSGLVRSSIAKYAIVAVLSWMVAFVVLRLDRADFNVLFKYESGDSLITATSAKTVIEHGWIFENPNLGAPFGQLFYDFPVFDSFHFFSLKVLGLLGGNYAWALNAYFVLLFPLTGLCCCAALSALRVSPFPAVMLSVVYTALPFRFYRNEHHLFLAAYQFVPLAGLVIIWFATWEPGRTPITRLISSFGRRRSLISALAIILVGLSGIYFAFFTAFFLIAAAAYRGLRSRSVNPLAASAVLVMLLIVTVVANIAPSIAFWARNGSGSAVVRNAGEASFYGLRITSALMPITDHRIPQLANMRKSYTAQVPWDDGSTSFGALGTFGFIALLAIPFLPRLPESHRDLLLSLSFLTFSGVLFATSGGFGQLFAFLVSPAIRDYGRISPFLSFFALAGIAVGIDLLRRRYSGALPPVVLSSSFVLIGLFALADQTSAGFAFNYAGVAAELRSDREFVASIERAVPRDSMLFQLPYVPFPESPPVVKMIDYDFYRCYLNSRTLRWSYGAIRGRFADTWIRNVAARPLTEMLDAVSLAGFAGIVIDRYGYVDSEKQIEQPLRRELGGPSTQSPNGRFAFYSLQSHRQALKSQLTESEWRGRVDRLMKPLYLEWQDGFWSLEGSPADNHRWCDRKATLLIVNRLARPIEALATTRACSGSPVPSAFRIEGAGIDYSTTLTSSCNAVNLRLHLPPGNTFIKFKSDANRIVAQHDPRSLYFRLENFVIGVDGNALDILENK